MKEAVRKCIKFMRSIDSFNVYLFLAFLILGVAYALSGIKFKPDVEEQVRQEEQVEQVKKAPNELDTLAATRVVVEPTTVAITEVVTEATTEVTTEEVATTEEPKPEISAEGPGEVYYYNVSEEEKLMMAKVVYREAMAEPLVGQIAVAAVILNRWMDPEWPDTISDVILQPNQFAGIGGVGQEQLDSYPDCERAVELALLGWDPTRKIFPEEGAKFFSAPGITFSEDNVINVDAHTIGHHKFRESFN